MHYAGSETRGLFDVIPGTIILIVIALFFASVTNIVLPIYMACRYNCKKKTPIILSLFIPFVGWLICPYLIAREKKQSKFYENTGKNVSWFHIVLYALNIVALFAPMTKVRYLDQIEIEGITKFNLSFFLGEKSDLIENFINADDYKILLTMIWILLIASIIGIVINLIVRDARKPLLLMFNVFLQSVNLSIVYIFANLFNTSITKPGIAFLWETILSIIFFISLYVVVHKTSYEDN